MNDAKYQGVCIDDKGFHVVLFPRGAEHAETLRLSLQDQQDLLLAICRYLAARSSKCAALELGQVIPRSAAP